MKLRILGAAGVIVVGLAVWMALKPTDWQNWLGFSNAAYFKNGQNYAFASGVGPMILTAIGMSTIIASLWRAHNCHHDGCWNIGKHKVNGTPWCNLHHEEARHAKTTEQLLEEILAELRGGPSVIRLDFQGGLSEGLADAIRDYVRRHGGNGPGSVQNAFGGG